MWRRDRLRKRGTMAILSFGEGCVGSGITAAGEVIMLPGFSVQEQMTEAQPIIMFESESNPNTAVKFSCCFVGRLVSSHPSGGCGPDDVDWLRREFGESSQNDTTNKDFNSCLRISDYNVWLQRGDEGKGYCCLFRLCGVRYWYVEKSELASSPVAPAYHHL